MGCGLRKDGGWVVLIWKGWELDALRVELGQEE